MYRLMIVDDSNIICNKIARCQFGDQFRIVGKANSGEQAIQLFVKTKPNFVTMDLTMPGMDGLECIRELLELDPNLLILVVSALSDKYTALSAIVLGARGFLNKPFTDQELVSAIKKIAATDKK